MTMTSTPPERTSMSAISSACSPVSGWEISMSPTLTPSLPAYTGSRAFSASMYAATPPALWTCATTCRQSVVFPEASGPYTSTTRPLGSPPTPSAMSSPSEPVDTTDKSLCTWASPIFMIEPLPNCFSIWASAAASALLLLSSIEFIPLDLTKLMLLIAAPFLVDRPGDCCIERSFDTTPFGLGQTVDQALQRDAHGFAADRRAVARQKALLRLMHRGSG